MNTTRKTVLAMLVAFLAVGIALVIWNVAFVTEESTSPDRLDLGQVDVGATVEFSARFLVSSHRRPLERALDAVEGWAPALTPILSRLRAKRAKEVHPKVLLDSLKPKLHAPDFIQVGNFSPEQNTNWYHGYPFVVVNFVLNTTRPGTRSGGIRLTLERRGATLPIRATIRDGRIRFPKLLVASTPYEAYSTEDGSDFQATTELLSSLPLTVDFRHRLPTTLDPYQVVLLADTALVLLTTNELDRVQSFVNRGGRLVLACNAFMAGSVRQANQLIEPRGLQVVDQDFGSSVSVTNLPRDILTEGVAHVEFYRPSLIQLTSVQGAEASVLVPAPNGTGGFVARTRGPGGGEIVVLTSSLWWNWLGQFATNSDNARLLRNILIGGSASRR